MEKKIKWTKKEDELLEVLMMLPEKSLLNLLDKYKVEMGNWSPPYISEEKQHFAIKIMEEIPYEEIIKEIDKKIKELDVIKLREDIKKHNLKKGQEGTIVMLYGVPPVSADVEFIDKITGKTITLLDIPLDILEVVWSFKKHEK